MGLRDILTQRRHRKHIKHDAHFLYRPDCPDSKTVKLHLAKYQQKNQEILTQATRQVSQPQKQAWAAYLTKSPKVTLIESLLALSLGYVAMTLFTNPDHIRETWSNLSQQATNAHEQFVERQRHFKEYRDSLRNGQ